VVEVRIHVPESINEAEEASTAAWSSSQSRAGRTGGRAIDEGTLDAAACFGRWLFFMFCFFDAGTENEGHPLP